MAISSTRYVDITSGVGGGNNVRLRELIGRIFTTNPLVPPQSYIEFTEADDVASYFGSTSEEYARAAFYFGWLSKNITKPEKISFGRWVDAAAAPRIYGAKGIQSLGSWTSITSGAFTLTQGVTTNTMSGLNFSSAASLSDVASIIQTAIRTETGAAWTGATVTYDATRQSFNFVGGSTGAQVISVAAGPGGSDIAAQLGWLSATAILAPGSAVETLTDTLISSAALSNNFGSFLFMPHLNNTQNIEVATWNDTQNNLYTFCVDLTASNAAGNSANLIDFAGVALVLSPLDTEFPEQIPMMIEAATDYNRRNSVQNYMFQQFAVTPSVTTNADADTYDALRVNYYGQTQTAGQVIEFFQRGVLTGLATDPVDMNTYSNEKWFKDAAAAAIFTLLLSLPKVSANATGRSQLLATLQAPIDQALSNGTISVGKNLTTAQKLFIAQITGDPQAWYQVQASGYWFDVVFESYVTIDSRTEYKAVYTLVYSKDDTIRKVDGTHILI